MEVKAKRCGLAVFGVTTPFKSVSSRRNKNCAATSVNMRRENWERTRAFISADRTKLNLRAQNMNIFTQLAEGIDDGTWSYHLAAADYSRWLRESVKDQSIADEVEAVEKRKGWSCGEPYADRGAIRKHYTDPA